MEVEIIWLKVGVYRLKIIIRARSISNRFLVFIYILITIL